MIAWFRRLCCKVGIHAWKPVFRYHHLQDEMSIFDMTSVSFDHWECRICGKGRE